MIIGRLLVVVLLTQPFASKELVICILLTIGTVAFPPMLSQCFDRVYKVAVRAFPHVGQRVLAGGEGGKEGGGKFIFKVAFDPPYCFPTAMTHNTDPPQECQSQQEATTANQSLQRINEDVLQQIATALQQIADTQRSILHRLDAHETMSTDSRISLQSSRSYQSSASMRSLTTATRRTTLVARPTEQKPGRTKRTLPRTTKGDIITKIVNPNNDKDEEVVEGLVRTISSFADDAISDHARRCHGHDIPAATWARTPRQHRNTTIEYFQQTVLEKLNIDMTCAEKSLASCTHTD